jgi:hypothetical protein
MTFAQFLGLLQADPAILIPGGAQSSRHSPMGFISHGRDQAILRRRSDAEPGAKRNIRKLVRGVIAFRRAGKKK